MKKAFLLSLVLVLIASVALTACGSGAASVPTPKGDAAAGQKLFTTCTACHGPKGEGMPSLGKDMTTSKFITEKTDDQLVEFLKVGRGPTDPLNTTGVAMPPKGGNPALTDQNLYDIVAYVRSLQKK